MRDEWTMLDSPEMQRESSKSDRRNNNAMSIFHVQTCSGKTQDAVVRWSLDGESVKKSIIQKRMTRRVAAPKKKSVVR